AYGIVQYLTGWQKIFTFNKIFYRETATGTFINHNHFAGFLELTFPFVFGAVYYSFQIWQDMRRRGPARVDAATVSSAGVQTLFFAFLLVVSIVAILFSRSRAGIVAAFFTVVFLGLLAQIKTKRKAWMLGFAAFVLVAIGYGLWIGVNPVVSRFEAFRGGVHYLQGEGRLSFWQSTLGMIHDYPVAGTGLGTFRFAFPHYQTYFLNNTVTHAHSDFLEFTSDTGLLGAALLFLPIIALLVLMIRSFLTDARRYRPSVTLGCIGATMALLIHSVADFNLHIPANALVFAVVLGVGYKIAWLERGVERAAAAAAVSRPAVSGRVHRKSRVM
ncbi:MAG: O-antigen ligase family protein, partial [Terriglobia bacterium]